LYLFFHVGKVDPSAGSLIRQAGLSFKKSIMQPSFPGGLCEAARWFFTVEEAHNLLCCGKQVVYHTAHDLSVS
jgi:hypothetical protein